VANPKATPKVDDGLLEIEPDASDVRSVLLAESIEAVSDAMKRLTKSGLNRRAIIVLTQDAIATSGRRRSMSLAEIETVLDAIETLKSRYCR
jgi:hypothetical protein